MESSPASGRIQKSPAETGLKVAFAPRWSIGAPSRLADQPASSLTVNQCARNVSSVHPCGLPARISSARNWSAPGPRFRGFTAIGHVRVSRGGCSCQCGRASATMIPQFVHIIPAGTKAPARHRTAGQHS
jgi:hypothetical protein